VSEFIVEERLHPDYPLPDLDDPIMRPFWQGAHEGRLMQQRDRTTGAAHWPPKPLYWKGGDRLEWFQASGRGTVYTYVVGYEPFLPAFRHLLPHVMVVVQLEEGARIVGHMVGCTPEEMRIGLPVRVRFKRLTDTIALPVWEPAR
jgi:uncharacterized OB-fold protein